MEHSTSEMERLEWRRDKVQELSSKGYSQREIARILQVGLGSVNRDLTFIRQQAKNNIKKYIDERLPEEYEKCMVLPTGAFTHFNLVYFNVFSASFITSMPKKRIIRLYVLQIEYCIVIISITTHV